MAIDDVGFLVGNSTSESALLFIDSSMRDTRVHPTPSEYVIPLDEPLRNVHGFNILDASIPGTMYTVDSHNDALLAVCVDCERSGAVARARAGCPPGDLDAQEHAEVSAISAEMLPLGNCEAVRHLLRVLPPALTATVVVTTREDVWALTTSPTGVLLQEGAGGVQEVRASPAGLAPAHQADGFFEVGPAGLVCRAPGCYTVWCGPAGPPAPCALALAPPRDPPLELAGGPGPSPLALLACCAAGDVVGVRLLPGSAPAALWLAPTSSCGIVTARTRRLVLARTSCDALPLVKLPLPASPTPLSAADAARAGQVLYAGDLYGLEPGVADGGPLAGWLRGIAEATGSAGLMAELTVVPSRAVGGRYDVVMHAPCPVTQACFDQLTSAAASASSPLLLLRAARLALERGNYTPSTLQAQVSQVLAGVVTGGLVCGTGSTRNPTMQMRLSFQAPGTATRLLLLCDPLYSSASELLGLATVPSPGAAEQPRAARPYNAVPFGVHADPGFMSVLRDGFTSGTPQPGDAVGQVLDCPGIMQLNGVRYITLRCPDLEQHMCNTGPLAAGLGVFKLGSVGDIAQLRFDFVNVRRRPFHPVGRLTRLSFRFEMPGGALYDFKGANHQMLVSLHYYAGCRSADAPAVPSVLNPDYNPDFLRYMLDNAPTDEEEGDEEDEEEEEGP